MILARASGVLLVGTIDCAGRDGRVRTAVPAADAAETVATWLAGSFSSAAQAARDSDYRDIRLHMARIWTARDDGPWLYVEQAVAGAEDAPYRQRVYRIVRREDGTLESRVFTLPEPERFTGAWKETARLDALRPDVLAPREGCAIALERRDDGTFAGSTRARDCPSDLRGASYATSEVSIRPDGMTSWDRGFDAEGRQVWGATKGGYEFVRQAGP